MKKLLLVAGLFQVVNTVLAGNFIPFNTIEKAQVHCPAVDGLTFTANNATRDSAGTITAYHGRKFESSPPGKAVKPRNMDPDSGKIMNAQFHSSQGLYGYISNEAITCLYSYAGITSSSVAVILHGKQGS